MSLRLKLFLFFILLAIFSPTIFKKTNAATNLSCVTGVAVPEEQAVATNTNLGPSISRIKDSLGIPIAWQLFKDNSTEADWMAYFNEARRLGMKVLFANTEADNYVPAHPNMQQFNPNLLTKCKFILSPSRPYG